MGKVNHYVMNACFISVYFGVFFASSYLTWCYITPSDIIRTILFSLFVKYILISVQLTMFIRKQTLFLTSLNVYE